MAGRESPTNEYVVELLQQVLRALEDLAVRQERVEANLAELTKATR